MRIGVLGTGMVGRAISGKLDEHGEVVVNCTNGAASLDALAAAGAGNLDGKVLIDVANPLDFSSGGPALFTDTTGSLGERIQAAFPDARVVKAFNTMNCTLMVAPDSVPGDHVVFVCGNDDAAKQELRALIAEFGWPEHRIVDLGDITASRGTEHYLMLWLRLMGAVGGPNFNISVSTIPR